VSDRAQKNEANVDFILRELPDLPPLPQLNPGIQRKLNKTEIYKDLESFKSCSMNMGCES
jgi:hypothetical protein